MFRLTFNQHEFPETYQGSITAPDMGTLCSEFQAMCATRITHGDCDLTLVRIERVSNVHVSDYPDSFVAFLAANPLIDETVSVASGPVE